MKDIPWYEWLYSVTEDWQIWSYPKLISVYRWKRLNPWRCLSACKSKWYYLVSLTKENNRRSIAVHRLVALTYIPNPDNKPQVNHINWIKTDNRVENLEWCTALENQLHAWGIWLQVKTIPMLKSLRYESDKHKKGIVQMDKQSNIIAIYESVREAAIKTNGNFASIWQCARWWKNRTTSWGFIWKYI